ncbi:4-hydroxy-tetrahydrodipicolinate synthase [Mesorhizobium sp. BHbdii]
MNNEEFALGGLWLPLVTPFLDGELDTESLKRLIRHYVNQPLDGFVLAGTTGEELTLDEEEIQRLVETVTDELGSASRHVPVLLGMSGSNTKRLRTALLRTQRWPVAGYLLGCPAYSKPSQDGLVSHFLALSENTDRPIVIYNIPNRTGVNLLNESLLRLAEVPNIVGVKDCCANAEQTIELISRQPDGFYVMTGEDATYFSTLCVGANGAILASSHVRTVDFANIQQLLGDGRLATARQLWFALRDVVKLLFCEPNPAAIKYWLWREGLIESPELRLPMTVASKELRNRIDRLHSSNQS